MKTSRKCVWILSFLIFRKAEIQMGRTYMRVYAILFGTLIGFTTYFYTIQDMKAKMQTEAVQLEYIGGAPGGYKGSKAKNEAEVTSKWTIVLILDIKRMEKLLCEKI